MFNILKSSFLKNTDLPGKVYFDLKFFGKGRFPLISAFSSHLKQLFKHVGQSLCFSPFWLLLLFWLSLLSLRIKSSSFSSLFFFSSLTWLLSITSHFSFRISLFKISLLVLILFIFSSLFSVKLSFLFSFWLVLSFSWVSFFSTFFSTFSKSPLILFTTSFFSLFILLFLFIFSLIISIRLSVCLFSSIFISLFSSFFLSSFLSIISFESILLIFSFFSELFL